MTVDFNPLISITADAEAQPSRTLPARELVSLYRTGKHRQLVAKIRKEFSRVINETGDLKAAKAAVKADKNKLDGVMTSGLFKARGAKNLDIYSQLLCGDVDGLTAENVGVVYDQIVSDPHCLTASVSPTNSGVKFLSPTTGNAEQHKQSIAAMVKYFRDTYQIELDPSCKNLERLCFAPDNASDWNPDAVPFEPLPIESKAERVKILAAPSIHPSTRTQIAERILGAIEWTNEVAGFCKCPGEHLHTTPNSVKDCMVMLDSVPTIKCFHGSCAGIVGGVNHELRSQIAKAEFAPTRTPQAAQPENGSATAPDPLPGNDDPPATTAPQPPMAKSLGDLKRRTVDDPNELLRTGYLCRGGGMLLAAPTGIGKSSWAMQAMIFWAICRAFFGITPTRPLKSLLIQAENDDGDLAEMRDGVIAGMGLNDEEKRIAMENVIVVQENTRTGKAFVDYTVEPLLGLHKPDLLWIDPALSYIGGNASAQEAVGFFLRNLLNPVLTKHGCGCVVVHHTNKPSKGEEKSAWQAGDFAYLGSGSAEWANWARAVLAIRSIGSHDVFELYAGKRGHRIGWKDGDGKISRARFIGHAIEPGVICWRDADEPESVKGKGKRPGTQEDLKALVPLEKPIDKKLLLDKWKDIHGNKDKGNAFLSALIADEQLFVWVFKRSGTNDLQMIARKPQTKP